MIITERLFLADIIVGVIVFWRILVFLDLEIIVGQVLV